MLKSVSRRLTRHFIGKVSMVIIMLESLENPPSLDVMYWLTEATMQVAPELRDSVVSSAIPVFLLRITEDDRRRYRASSKS